MSKFHLSIYAALFFFLALYFHIPSIKAEDSQALDAQDRVIRGRSCSTKQYGFIVLVIKTRNLVSYRVCGGTLIKPGWVLTAAHCLEDSRLNSYSVLIAANTHKKTILVKQYYIHSKYDKHDSHVNDIALLELTSELDADLRSGDIKFVTLPKPEDPVQDPFCDHGLIMGWGKMGSSEVPEISNLQCGDVELIPTERCKDFFSFHIDIYRNQMCTVSKEGVEPYLGDSGGPLLCGEVQVGIISWGMGKHTMFPAVFTKVRDHLDFINQLHSRSSGRESGSGTCALGPILFLYIFMPMCLVF